MKTDHHKLAAEMIHRVQVEAPQREDCRALIACGAYDTAEILYGAMAHEPGMGMPEKLTAEFREQVRNERIR